jgi:hypothetical protein
MNPGPWSLTSAVRALAGGWNGFFHRPCDARVCAAVRIVYAALVLVHLAVLWPDLDLWFADQGVLPLENARQATSAYSWTLFSWWPNTPDVIRACCWLMVGHTVALLFGFLPRLNALFLFVWLVSLQNRNDLILDGEDTLMRMLAFFLIWIPSGECWSLNAVIRKWITGKRAADNSRQAELQVPGWGLHLLQIEMALILFTTGLIKLSGKSWLDGTALYYVSRLDDTFGRFPIPAILFDTPWIVALLTWVVLTVELTIPLLIWFRETRRACLVALVAFHLTNEWTMNLFLFHWLMLCGWISFLAPDDFAWPRFRSATLVPRANCPLNAEE